MSGPGHPLPAGWAVELDAHAARFDGGRTLVGGFPLRVLRFTDAGRRWLDRLAAPGGAVPEGAAARSLARRLVDGGLAVPRPAPPSAHGPGDVAVVVPVRDDAEGLAATLASIGPVGGDDGVGEVIVVDDGSRTPVARDGANGVRVLRHDASRGPAAARNTGWRATTRPVVAFVDADVVLPEGWLPALLAHLDDPATAAVAPRIRASAGRAPGWLAAYEAHRFPLDLGPLPSPVRPAARVSYVPTAAVLVRRAALEAVGGFDEALRLGEDVDLVWRLAGAGHGVRYEPAVEARHPSRPTLAAALRQRFRYGTSTSPLAVRHGRAGAPLGISGWSALAWGALALGRPRVGLAVAAGTTAALVPKLQGLDEPVRASVALAGKGHLHAGRAVADALRRPWWPLAALVGALVPRSRPPLVAAAVVPPLLEWCQARPALDPARWVALRLADDVAYGAGVWAGCWRARSAAALAPRFAGPVPPPQAPAPTPA